MSSLFIPHGKISPSLSLVPDLTQTTRQTSLQPGLPGVADDDTAALVWG